MALTLIVHARVSQKRFAPWRLEFFVDFVRKRAAVYPRVGFVRLVSLIPLTAMPRKRTFPRWLVMANGNPRVNLAITSNEVAAEILDTLLYITIPINPKQKINSVRESKNRTEFFDTYAILTQI